MGCSAQREREREREGGRERERERERERLKGDIYIYALSAGTLETVGKTRNKSQPHSGALREQHPTLAPLTLHL